MYQTYVYKAHSFGHNIQFTSPVYLLDHITIWQFYNVKGTGDDPAAQSEYLSGFSGNRKIDLTSYIKWWGSNKSRQPDSGTKDACSELKTLEQQVLPTESYQMPKLGMPHDGQKHKKSSVSALSILSRSAAYKSLQEKASKKEENSTDPDENENKSTINKLDRGKEVEKSSDHEAAIMGMSGTLSLQRDIYPLAPIFLSAPLLTAYNSVDPLVDPVLWTSLAPMLPAGPSRIAEVGKFAFMIYFLHKNWNYMIIFK